MENREHSACQDFVDFMTGEMSEVERKRFERHMDTCAACREDAAEWRLVWDRLSDDVVPAVLPPDLKEEVLESAFAAEAPAAHLPAPSIPRKRPKPFKWLAMAVAFAIAFLAGFGWRGMLPDSEPGLSQADAQPSHIEKLMRLETTADNRMYKAGKSAYGVACLIRSNDEVRLVIYTFGTKETQGDSVYHVWLLKDGNRSSAGTYSVDETGIGLLIIPWTDESPVFDKVGVTLEPDPHSTSPRGQKMFQSV